LKSILDSAPQAGQKDSLVLRVPAGNRYYLATEAEYLAQAWATLLYDDPSLKSRTILWATTRGTDCARGSAFLNCRGEEPGERYSVPLASVVLLTYSKDQNRFRREDRAGKMTLRESGYPSSLGRSILEAPVFLARFLLEPANEPPPPLSKSASTAAPAAPLQGNLDAVRGLGSQGPQYAVRRGSPAEALGWALIDGRRQPREVLLLIDGQEIGRTSAFFARRDVTASFHHDTDPCGWQIVFFTDRLIPGSHSVQVQIIESPGSAPRPLESSLTIEVLP
jgi:hypothetical protein